MNPSDLRSFFDKYVPRSNASAIHKFVGDGGGDGGAGIEASLDVDYIMGVAPGVLTEFWYYATRDFCGDLLRWTDSILSSDDPPLVHSVSYGWQGSLSSLGCKDANVKEIDGNFAKLAAKGITIIFASGDSGSGYVATLPISACRDPLQQLKDTAVDQGELMQTIGSPTAKSCCGKASRMGGTGWTFLLGANGQGGSCNIYSSV